VNPYRWRILHEMQPLLRAIQPLKRVLDVGAGDGWFAMSLEGMGICDIVTAIDVMPRQQAHHPVNFYDGERLPFPTMHSISFMQSMSSITPLILPNCSRRWLVVPGTTCCSKATPGAPARGGVAAMDEVGNRRFGVHSAYNYQRGLEWDEVLQKQGLKKLEYIHPLPCHIRLLGRLTNNLQFLALWTANRHSPALLRTGETEASNASERRRDILQ